MRCLLSYIGESGRKIKSIIGVQWGVEVPVGRSKFPTRTVNPMVGIFQFLLNTND